MSRECCLEPVKTVPSRQLNVLWVVVCAQIKHCINKLHSLHFQHLQVCKKKCFNLVEILW